METALMNYSSADYKHQIGNPTLNYANNRSLYSSYPSDNLLLSSFLSGRHFTGGSFYQPTVSAFWPPQSVYNNRQLPPLLPLPITMPRNFNSVTNIRLSSPRINKHVKTRGRDHSLTMKKSKNQQKDLKKPETDLIKKEVQSINQIIGPDPKDLPKDVISRVFSSSVNSSYDIVDKFSGSGVFAPSPPPSSLPLPTFSLRPKISCHVEATGDADDGATDNLRRLLRL